MKFKIIAIKTERRLNGKTTIDAMALDNSKSMNLLSITIPTDKLNNRPFIRGKLFELYTKNEQISKIDKNIVKNEII